MIETNVTKVRDPFVLVDDNAYYLYGTGVNGGDWINSIWACYKNEEKSLNAEWKPVKERVYMVPENAAGNFWAPEVHKYNGFYYMFATYYSSATEHRGCTILKSESPEGPFVEITGGHITPADWDAIDGTLYVDKKGQPWMVFVHEWTSMDDEIGRMAAAKLSDDFTHFISEPIELFRADEPSWASAGITDGCFMYRTKEDELLMIWSNFCKDGYCVGIAKSENGEIDGKWIQQDELLFSRETHGKYDGGHGMIFKDTDGKLYMSLHVINSPSEGESEKTVFIPLYEKNGTLVCEI